MYHGHELDELRFDHGYGQPIRSGFEMAGKVFTAFPIGRLTSAALATAHVHDTIGSSFYREIDKNNHG